MKITVKISPVAIREIDGCDSEEAIDAIETGMQDRLAADFDEHDVSVERHLFAFDTQRIEVSVKGDDDAEADRLAEQVAEAADRAMTQVISDGDWAE